MPRRLRREIRPRMRQLYARVYTCAAILRTSIFFLRTSIFFRTSIFSLKVFCHLCYANQADREERGNERDRWYRDQVVIPVTAGSVPSRESSRLSVWW
jgi:hypothetical protein